MCEDGWAGNKLTFKALAKRESYSFGMMILSKDGAMLQEDTSFEILTGSTVYRKLREIYDNDLIIFPKK